MPSSLWQRSIAQIDVGGHRGIELAAKFRVGIFGLDGQRNKHPLDVGEVGCPNGTRYFSAGCRLFLAKLITTEELISNIEKTLG